MPHSWLKLTWSITLLALPLAAQHWEFPLDAGAWVDSEPALVRPSPVHQGPPRTISAELLRYPLSEKEMRMLRKALNSADTGDHLGAIKQLQTTLNKSPATSAYVYSLLGVEYLKTGQFSEAVNALEQAVTLLPHDASNHANLGLALACKGQYDRAAPELERALDLEPHNKVASQLLSKLDLSKNPQK